MAEDAATIRKALNQLMNACGFRGESGSETLFPVLLHAVEAVDAKWDNVVEQSHEDGLRYDVNALLADELVRSLKQREKLMIRVWRHSYSENLESKKIRK